MRKNAGTDAAYQTERDYDFIERILKEAQTDREREFLLRLTLCNSLLVAFAAYHDAVSGIDLTNWSWLNWFRQRAMDISFVVSLNYDLTLERVLRQVGIPYYASAIRGEAGEVHLFKPHGSLDYGWPQWLIEQAADWSEATGVDLWELQNNYYERLSPQQLGSRRVSCDIVLPSDYNRIRHYGVIKDGYDDIKRRCASLKELAIIGVSYWPCDRPELDDITDSTPSNCNIVLYNPKPSQEWKDRLAAYQRNVNLVQ
jgi:hypothetical protein